VNFKSMDQTLFWTSLLRTVFCVVLVIAGTQLAVAGSDYWGWLMAAAVILCPNVYTAKSVGN